MVAHRDAEFPHPWKAITIVLAVILAMALICGVVIFNGVMKLGISLI